MRTAPERAPREAGLPADAPKVVSQEQAAPCLPGPGHRASPPFQALTDFDPPLDEGIAGAVIILRRHNVETSESCQGGEGHAFPEPTIRFFGGRAEGLRALSVAVAHDLPVTDLRRTWDIVSGEIRGPEWEMVFARPIPLATS